MISIVVGAIRTATPLSTAVPAPEPRTEPGKNVCWRCNAVEGEADPEKHGSAKWQPGVCWNCY